MKKTGLVIIGLLLILGKLLPQDMIPLAIAKTLEDLDTISSFFPRYEGSPQEMELFQFLEQRLQNQEISFTRFEYSNSVNYHSFSSALVVNLAGTLQDTLLISIPVNHPAGVDANSSGSINIALGLALVSYLKDKELPISVQINFMGAEFGTTDIYPLGSNLYLEHYFPEYPVMHLYLNFKNIPDRISIRCGGQNSISPYWMITSCTEALQTAGVAFLIRGNENQLFRFGLGSDKNNLEPFLSRDFPSLSFEGEYSTLTDGEKKDWLFSTLNFFEILISRFTDGIPQEWDRHYLFFQAKSFFLIIKEQIYLAAVIIILMLAIMYILIFTQISKTMLKIFFKYLWAFFVILIISFILIFLSGLTLEAISIYKKNPALWQANPLLFFLYKLCLIFCFYIFIRRLIRVIPFPGNHTFYLSAGIISLLLNMLAIAVINISFTYYFLWAFFLFLLSNISRNKVLRLFFFLPSSYWIVKTTVEFLYLAQPAFSRFLLLSGMLESLIIASLLLPFILQTISILKKFSVRWKRRSNPLFNILVFTVTAGFSLYLLFFSPYNANNLQHVRVTNTIDINSQVNTVELASTGSLGNINLQVEDKPYFIDTEAKKFIIPLDYFPELLEVENTQKAFLDRKNITLSIATQKPSLNISLVITSGKEFILFDSNFPFKRRQKGTEYEILIGAHPPNPLSVQLTLPAGYSFDFHFDIEYLDFPFRFELTGRNKSFDTSLIIKQKIRLDT